MIDRTNPGPFVRLLFTLSTRPSWESVGMFGLGVVSLAVLASGIYEAARNVGGSFMPPWLAVGIVIVVLAALAFVLYQGDRRRNLARNAIEAQIDESEKVQPHRGLIWLLSPGNINHPAFAIAYHYGHEPHLLKHCWLVMTREDGRVQEAREALATRLEQLEIAVELHPVYVRRPDVESTYRAIREIYQTEVPAVGLTADQVAADITGGLKPMTTGMVLACLLDDLDLEYIETDRDEEGRPIESTHRVVQVNVSFFRTDQKL